MPVPVVLIFDIGKTNKKLFLFDESYQIVYEKSAHLDQTLDDDGDSCEDINRLQAFIMDELKSVLALPDYLVRAVNFSAYGASLVYLDAEEKIIGHLYNYLKKFPAEISRQFYGTYGGEVLLSFQTASPVLGSLNSGMQLYRLKHEKPDFFKNVKYALHLPQCLSYLVSGKAFAEITSIGCHTNLWNFRNMDYHDWVKREGLLEKFPPLVPSDMVIPPVSLSHAYSVGVGLHDSSAALIPYLVSFPDPFVLISTGTWAISLNPFNSAPLTKEELECDCLCYLQYRGTPVKASRLFAGHNHDEQVDRIAVHFNQNKEKYFALTFDKDILSRLDTTFDPADPDTKAILTDLRFAARNLSDFATDAEAYHQLVFDLMVQQYFSAQLVIKGAAVKRIFVDGGFSNNAIYMNLLAAFFPQMEVFASSIPQATAIGAALAIHEAWNPKEFSSRIINLKRYPARLSFSPQ